MITLGFASGPNCASNFNRCAASGVVDLPNPPERFSSHHEEIEYWLEQKDIGAFAPVNKVTAHYQTNQ